MECNDARFYLRFRRPGPDDLDPDALAALDRHLAGCPRCAAEARRVAAFDEAVGAAMRAVPVPDGLRGRLLAAAAGKRRAAARGRVYRLAAAAASVLVAVALAASVFSVSRPRPDTNDLAARGDALAATLRAAYQPVNLAGDHVNPQQARANEDAVRAWLAGEGVTARLPEPFDFGLLFSFHWEDVQGRKVPVVWFRERGGVGFAKVYAFRSTQFDLRDVPEVGSSFCAARPYPDRAAGVVFVVVHTGQDLSPFLRAAPGDPV